MEIEGVEQQIFLQPEMAIVGAVYSVNGYTGHVVLTTSDLENTSDYQTSTDVATLISAHNTSEEAHPYIQALISSKQDPIVAGNGISITGGNTVAIDTTVVATQQNLATEVTNRENADIALQGQIDAISASSDVVDIVGTYAELQSYDTSKLKDNDIIKVLQDSTQGNATTYYRWSTTTQTFTLIGQEGPYYTKAAADAQFVPQTRTINSKPLSANITLTASDVSALGQSDVVQTTGTSTSQVMSQNAVTTALATKLDSADVPAGFFDGPATTSPTPATSVELNNVLKLSELELLGDTSQDTTTGKNLMPVSSYDTSIARSTFLPTLELPAGTYNISFDITSITLGTNTSFDLRLSLRDSDGVGHNIVTVTINASTQLNRVNKTFTISYDAVQDARSNIGIIQTAYDAGGRVAVDNIQIEAGSESTTYEPYTGGAPSPNPDYPQTVEVVTGEQTISVSDGTNSTDYTVDLGNIELCRIGNYQDYIYQGNDGWYVHKEIGKTELVTQGLTWSYLNVEGHYRFYTNYIASMVKIPSSTTTIADILSSAFVADTFSNIINDINNNRIGISNNGEIVIYASAYTTVASFEAAMANEYLYYVLATPTDTKITDSTLTWQLDALLSAQMYPEYTAISSNGNLPAILGITAYNSNLNGIIEVLASTAGALGNVNSALNIINNGGN